MRFIRIFFIIVCIVIGAYVCGWNAGRIKCHSAVANDVAQQLQQQIKITEETHAETMHTGMRDIRRVLREKYTIAE